MGDAYTPGLTVTRHAMVRKTRRLPLPGQVMRKVGDVVKSSDVVARTELPGKVHLMNLATALGAMPDEVAPQLRLQPGDALAKGTLIAETKGFFGYFKTRVTSPIVGTLESVSEITGQAVLREPPVPVEVKAYVDGTIVEIIEGEGVIVETAAALVQGIFGLSGEVNATLVVVAKSPDHVLEPGDLSAAHAGKVVLGGGRTSLAAMRRAMELGVAAIVCGGIAYQDVKELLGYDVGVAVTGTEGLATTLVVTEGFGDIAMAKATYELLASLAGRIASVCGATQIRAGVIRPEVVVPGAPAAGSEEGVVGGLEIGAPVRCIRAPYFGRIGKVAALPVELATMPSETRVRVLDVDLGGGEIISVPRANVEVIER
ncbi:MAG TPA: hypothetical protein VM261_27195 [Kofleriaceae bacterium]|nr:hypothetical protein [Kofleriaceae bacterium]